MELNRLVHYKALNNIQGFKKDKEYICLGKDEEYDDFRIFVGENKSKISISKNNFKPTRISNSIKTVMCIYAGYSGKLTQFEKYSVYEYIHQFDIPFKRRYAILTDDSDYSNIPRDFFMDIDEFNKIKDSEDLNDIINDRKTSIFKEIKAYEVAINKRIDSEQKKEFIKDVIETNANKTETNSTDKKEERLNNKEKSKDIKEDTSFDFPSIGYIVAIMIALKMVLPDIKAIDLDNSSISTIITALIFIGVFVYVLFTKVICKDTVEDTSKASNELLKEIDEIDEIKLMNKLPVDILGKMKYIENNLVLLKKIEVSDEVLNLIRESVQLTSLLTRYEDDVVTETLIEKLNNYLDNTIEYVHSLRDNKEVEEQYIKEQIAGNIYDVIDKNAEVFKSMAKDNNLLTKHFNKE